MAIVLTTNVHSSNQYLLPSMEEKLVLLVLFLGNLMYCVCMETKRNKYKYEYEYEYEFEYEYK